MFCLWTCSQIYNIRLQLDRHPNRLTSVRSRISYIRLSSLCSSKVQIPRPWPSLNWRKRSKWKNAGRSPYVCACASSSSRQVQPVWNWTKVEDTMLPSALTRMLVNKSRSLVTTLTISRWVIRKKYHCYLTWTLSQIINHFGSIYSAFLKTSRMRFGYPQIRVFMSSLPTSQFQNPGDRKSVV